LKTSSPIFIPFGGTTFADTIPLATNVVPDAHVLNLHILRKFGRWDGAGNSVGTSIPEGLFIGNDDQYLVGFPAEQATEEC